MVDSLCFGFQQPVFQHFECSASFLSAVLVVAYYLAKWLFSSCCRMIADVHQYKNHYWLWGASWKNILNIQNFLGLVPGFADSESVALILLMKFKQEEFLNIYCMSCVACSDTVILQSLHLSHLLPFNLKCKFHCGWLGDWLYCHLVIIFFANTRPVLTEQTSFPTVEN